VTQGRPMHPLLTNLHQPYTTLKFVLLIPISCTTQCLYSFFPQTKLQEIRRIV
jgi:hypothetical protein